MNKQFVIIDDCLESTEKNKEKFNYILEKLPYFKLDKCTISGYRLIYKHLKIWLDFGMIYTLTSYSGMIPYNLITSFSSDDIISYCEKYINASKN